VLNDLLDMAQLEAGEFNLHMETADLHAICEEAMTSARGLLLDQEEVDLVRDYPAEWPQVYVDKMRLKQALLNLLGNAVKYTEKGHIALRVRSTADIVHLTVEDTGIGIPEEHLEKIFQEFMQVDETAARKRIGTGLGLPITRHLIERHGGSVSVASEVRKGSAFTLSIPIVQEKDEEEDITEIATDPMISGNR
jgi:two-component system sensor histidine kinase ChiS